MIYFFDGFGRITRRVNAPFDEASLAAQDGEQWIQSDEIYSDADFFVFNNAFTQFPPKPSVFHEWNWRLLSWEASESAIVDIKNRMASEINTIRDEKQYLPVLYDGVLFDADPQSRTAMTGLEGRIRQGGGLTSPWRGWRTYDNIFVWADATAEQVQRHLLNLQCLPEDRWQALLDVAWTKKDALSQFKTVDEVIAFDVESGWPDI